MTTTISNFTNFCKKNIEDTKAVIATLNLESNRISQAYELAKACSDQIFTVYSYVFTTTTTDEWMELENVWTLYRDEVEELRNKMFQLYLTTLEEV